MYLLKRIDIKCTEYMLNKILINRQWEKIKHFFRHFLNWNFIYVYFDNCFFFCDTALTLKVTAVDGWNVYWKEQNYIFMVFPRSTEILYPQWKGLVSQAEVHFFKTIEVATHDVGRCPFLLSLHVFCVSVFLSR